MFLSDDNEHLKTLYESFLPAGISLIGFTTFNGSGEISLINVSLEMLKERNDKMIKLQNPAIIDSLKYLKFEKKHNFKFSQHLIISGSDDWVTKVEQCFEPIFEKLKNLHFTETNAFIKPIDESCSVTTDPFVSIPFNFEIEHFGSESSEKKTETLRRVMYQLKELIKREGPEANFTKLCKYSSVLFDENQPFMSLKDSSGKEYFADEIANLANSKTADEVEPLSPMDLDFGKLLINPHLEVQRMLQ
uniref:Uncharacterized protein n=1 Tax=Panagrolaimus davidi TaxID=227884 RepID=A0A914PHC1_9BILA